MINENTESKISVNENTKVKNGVQLITYPDSFGTNLAQLHFVMKRYFKNCFTGVHILPFYPSSADRGFCPLTYEEVDQKFGNWEDIEKIAKEYDLMADFIPNHISRKSIYFQDYLEKGQDSIYYDMFLQIKKLYPEGRIPAEELKLIYLRKPTAPEFLIEFPDGHKEYIWQTFESDQQIDLDINSQVYKQVYGNFAIQLLRHGVKILRLDALAYVTKSAGTNCFFVEPDMWNYSDWMREFSDTFEAELVPEMHGHYSMQQKISAQNYRVYDFVLPLMLLHALYEGDSSNLRYWLNICPRMQLTTLDTHDGIPVTDCIDLMQSQQIERTWKKLETYGANINYNHAGENQQVVYQMNCTYYSALGNDDQAYLLARAIQFFTPGIPQVYYVGALAGSNDIETINKWHGEKIGGWGRDINRHNYSLDEIKESVKQDVVQRLIKLMEFRNSHPAFDGELTIENPEENEQLILIWQNGESKTKLQANLETKEFSIWESSKTEDWIEVII